jgi:hypothetical protein
VIRHKNFLSGFRREVQGWQVKLPFEKLVHALHNFPEGALQLDTFLSLAYNIKVPTTYLPQF